MRHVNRSVLWDVGRFGDLIAGDREMDAYAGAIYWRFLYEQCGGMNAGAKAFVGVKDPAAGMQIIRRALIALYAGDTVDIKSATDPISGTSGILDRALAGSSCPFQTYEESLTAFARALYVLRSEGGRCTAPGRPAGCGLYDPYHLYRKPHLKRVAFRGAAREVRRDLPSAYGVAFVEVTLDPVSEGQALALEFALLPASSAEVHLQVLGCTASGAACSEVLAEATVGGGQVHALSCTLAATYDRLGLIVTRLDAVEEADSGTEYRILLRPVAG
jgi:hypothetical protein